MATAGMNLPNLKELYLVGNRVAELLFVIPHRGVS